MAQAFDVAHVREHGQQVILIVVNASFGRLGSSDQRQYASLQRCATAAGMAGTVALV